MSIPVVSIICDVYNHAAYLRQCLDGFMMQQTSYPYEVLIHDDASTDESQQIIKEYENKYPLIIKPIYQTKNKYSKGISIWRNYQFPRAQGKYIALCEGDDYWIDPLKLQKQVEFLECNPEFGMVYTSSKIYNQSKNKEEECLFGSEYRGYDDLLAYNRISALTACINKEAVMKYINEIKPHEKTWLMGDYPMWLWIGYYYKIKFFPDITSVYRVLEESASHTRDIDKYEKFILSTIDITRFYINKLNLSPTSLYHQALNEYYYDLYSKYKDGDNYKKVTHYAKLIDTKYVSSRIRKEIRKFHLKRIKSYLLNILLCNRIQMQK